MHPLPNTLKGYLLTTLSVFGLCALSFVYVDKAVAYAVQPWQGSLLYSISEALSFFGEPKLWLGITGIALVIIAITYFTKRRWSGGMECFCLSNIVAIILADLLKHFLGRYRPQVLFDQNLYGFHFFAKQDSLFSSPSGHSVMIFSSMTVIAYLYPRYRWICWSFAVLVGLSRIAVARHYPSDVLFGAYIGILSANYACLMTKSRAFPSQLR